MVLNSTDDAHDLIPNRIAEGIPPLYSAEDEADPVAHVKLFSPDGCWKWFVTEYDAAKRLCFGLVIGHERELGYFYLEELEMLRGPLGLRIERDLYFKPAPISQCS